MKRAMTRMKTLWSILGLQGAEHTYARQLILAEIRAAYEAGLATAPRAGVVESGVISAAGRIFDLFGNSTAWRQEADLSDLYESADWAQAMLYARAALTAAPPAVPDPHAELVAAAYAYRAAWLTLDAAKDDPATYGDPFSEITGAHYDAREALCRAAERLPDRDGGAE